MKVLTIIPARGGSKGIKRKNLLQIGGNSLVGHSIQQSLASKLVTRTLVSTDDEEIKLEAIKNGAEVPFLRPAELAGDQVLDLPVFEHALNFLKETENYIPDIVVHLRPTAPYRKPEWIDTCIQLLIDNKTADSVRSVSEPEKHPYRMFTIDEQGYLDAIMKHKHPTPYLLRRQDLPPIYFYNCVIDVTRPSTIFNKKSMTGDRIFPYIMNPDDVIDIDRRQDVEIAELFFKNKLTSK